MADHDDDVDDDRSPSSGPASDKEPAPPPLPPPEELARRRLMLANRELIKAVTLTVRRGSKEARDEIVQTGLADALADPAFPPLGEDPLPFVTRKVKNAKDRFFARIKSRSEVEVVHEDADGIDDGPESVPPELAKVRETAEALAAEDTGARRALEMQKARHLEGLSVPEILARFGVSREAYKKMVLRFNAKVRAALLAAAALGVCLWLWLHPRERPTEPVAHEVPSAVPEPVAHEEPSVLPEPPPPPSAPPRKPRELTGVIAAPGTYEFGQALAACGRKEWRVCDAKLDLAEKIAPALAEAPEFKEARAAAARGIAAQGGKKEK